MRTVPDVSALADPDLWAHHGGPEFHRIHDNPTGTPNTIAFAVSERGYVTPHHPGQFTDSNLEFAPGYNTATGLGSPPGH